MERFSTKWGVVRQELGPSHSIQSVCIVQFVIVALVLALIRPAVVMTRVSHLRVAQLSPLRVLGLAALTAVGTYAFPLLSANA